jgi:hypothetical protein
MQKEVKVSLLPKVMEPAKKQQRRLRREVTNIARKTGDRKPREES